jgi:hypothetical protein
MQVELVVSPEFLPRPLPLGRRLLLGRSPEADLLLPMIYISRRHAGIEWTGCAVHIEDYQSRNGVFVNGRRLGPGPHPLLPDDVLYLAGVRLFLRGAVSLDPDWLRRDDGLLPRLIQQIGEERNLDALPILGDALEEMGCTDEDLLAHCHHREHAPDCLVFHLIRDAVEALAEEPEESFWPIPASLIRCELC